MRKFAQRRLYTFLDTRWGQTVVVSFVFLLLLSAFDILHDIVEALPGRGRVMAACSGGCSAVDYADNLAGLSFEERLCLPPVDVVITWVNGSEPRLQRELAFFRSLEDARIEAELRNATSARAADAEESGASDNATAAAEAAANLTAEAEAAARKVDSSPGRYRDNQELRYCIRSVFKYAPWVRKVFLVTNGQVPHWLNIDHPRLEVVPHSRIFPAEHLPTFSSPAIESHLHEIEGLSDRFVYFNDDVALGAPVYPDDFFSHAHGQKVYLAWDTPQCSTGCPDTWIGDGYCDAACNKEECGFDSGDCGNQTTGGAAGRFGAWSGSRGGSSWFNGASSAVRLQYCAPGCPSNWCGDKVKDAACFNAACAFDCGDGGAERIYAELPGLALDAPRAAAEIPPGSVAYYVNLTGVFTRVTEASHDNSEWVRGAVVTQRLGLLTLLLHSADTMDEHPFQPEVSVFLEGERNGTHANATITLTMEVAAPPAPPPPPPPADDPAAARLANATAFFEGLLGGGGDGAPASDSALGSGSPSSTSGGGGGAAAAEESVAPLVSVEGVPDSDDMEMSGVRLRRLMSLEDARLADRIAAVKTKELRELIQRGFEEEFGRAEEELRRERGGGAVWPWEVAGRVDASELVPHFLAGGAPGGEGARPAARRLLDTFGDSLRYVNALYAEHFGRLQRKVPAHMPHFIDRRVMAELVARWPERWAQTSAHRFRHSHDMQFSFSYFYYMMQVPDTFDLRAELDERLDMDRDNELSPLEVEYLAIYLHDNKRPDDGRMNAFYAAVHNCSLAEGEPYRPPAEERRGRLAPPRISRARVERCAPVVTLLETRASSRKKYRHEVVTDLHEVEFYMMPNNFTKVRDRLAEVRAKMPKFICLNDDMGDAADPRLVQTLHEFYESYFPAPTPFELPPDRYHRHTRLEDILAARGVLGSSVAQLWLMTLAMLAGSAAVVLAALRLCGITVLRRGGGGRAGASRGLVVV